MENTFATLDAVEPCALTDAERQPCEVWTRVMGYFRPVSSFNRGKQGEYNERTCFVESKCD
jgi:anaerobic ribonucleoside-triphosphate reductase